MKKRLVIAQKHLPVRSPFWASIIIWQLVDRYKISGIATGIVITVMALWWIDFFITWFNEEETTTLNQILKP